MNDTAHSNQIANNNGKDYRDPNLEQILRQAQAGSDPALTQLYNTYFERIYRFIFYRVSHKETAEDQSLPGYSQQSFN